jgi:hypothetical protein
MATKAEWEKEIKKIGGIFATIHGTPEWSNTKEGFMVAFEVVDNPKKGQLLKKTRDTLAKELRQDGWTVSVEPKSTFFNNYGKGESYVLTATRLK